MTIRDGVLAISAVVIYLSGFRIIMSLLQERAAWIERLRFPWVALTLLVAAIIVNIWQLADQSLFGSLARNQGDLGAGHCWKVITPLRIQSDGIEQLVSNTVSFLLVLPLAELVLGCGPVLALYLVGGVVGQSHRFRLVPTG